MAKKLGSSKEPPRKRAPARTPEARENQMISLAIDKAEEKLQNGTASSQIIVHYLKLGSMKDRTEREILEKQKDLLVAKTEAIKSQKRVDELYSQALSAMKTYSGAGNDEPYDD